MAWAAAAVFVLLALPNVVRADEDHMLDSVLVIGSETAGSNKRKLLQQMSGEPEPLMKWLVTKHNELRYRHGVQMLTWDWSLAWNSYNYVVGCPKGHSGQQGIGENLAWGHNDFNHVMRDWYDEIQFYNFNSPGFAENTGHFTQMVWRDAGKIGCAANLRCSFRTWICQFTPAGNLVNYGGSVDFNLWSTNVPAPSSQYITGTKPDGSPSYMLYDPTGESTRSLPQPRYGELKNFGYVPKPGQVVVITDWQKYIPTDVLQAYLPLVVLEKYLKPDILQLLRPEPEAVAKPGQPLHKEAQRAVVGWQQYLPTSVIKEYVPAPILAKYVPDGTVLATENDATGGQTGPGNNSSSSSSSSSGGGSSSPASSSTSTPAPVVSGPVVKQAADVGAATSLGSVSKPQSAPKAEPSVVAPATSEVFAAPIKEPYEAGTRVQQQSRQASRVAAVLEASKKASKDTAWKFRSTDAAVKPAMPVVARILKQQEKGPVAHAAAAAAVPAASKHVALQEAGPLERLFGGIAGLTGDAEPPPRYAYTPPGGASQPMYPTQNPGNPAYSIPVGHVPSRSQSEGYYVPQQPYAPQPRQQQPQQLQMPQQQQQQPPVYGSVPGQPGLQPLGMAGQPVAPPYASQPMAAVPLPSQQQGGQAAYQNPQAAYSNLQQPQPMPEQPQQQQPQLPAGMRDVLEAHNFYRARHQAQPVVWDEQLAASAMDAASKCPNSPSGTRGVGENLAWGFASGGAAVDEWYKEGKQYDFSHPGFTMTSGHFSQIVWQATMSIGCALVPSCSMSTFICHYSPPGNVMGSDWTEQVKPAPAGTAMQPRPKQPVAAVMPPGYPYPQQQQQPVAAVPQPWYPVQPLPQQQQQQQPVAAVPQPWYPVQQQQQPVTAVPQPGYTLQQPQQQQMQAVQPVAAVPRPGYEYQQPAQVPQAQPAQAFQGYPVPQTYQPFPPVDAVAKPQMMPIVAAGAAEQPHAPTHADQQASVAAAIAAARHTKLVESASVRSGDALQQPFSAPALVATDASSNSQGASSVVQQSKGPVTAATTKPYSAPAFLTPLAAAAVAKPSAAAAQGSDQQAASARASVPRNAPVQTSHRSAHDAPPHAVAAVGKPPFPVDVPRFQWPHVGNPASSSGAPFSLSAPMRPAAAAVLSPELQAALDRHNQYRSAHQAPPLIWDDSIASSAQRWAAGCPNGHSGTRGVGENMAWGYASLADAVDAWYNEVKLYDFSKPGWNTATGHFTALVWKSTSKLGCAVNAACSSWTTYVCQYGPPGNVIGVDWSQEVKPKAAKPAKPSLPAPTPAPSKPVPVKPSQAVPAPAKPKPSAVRPAPAKPSPAVQPPKPQKPVRKPAGKQPQLTADQRTALDKHNTFRARHGASALAWDAKLAAAAQAWADGCPWGHSNSEYGENMAWGYRSFAAVVDAWYSEVEDYDWGYAMYQPGSGHFSQVIWKSTTKLGCAVSKKCGWRTYVCNYDPAGNVQGRAWQANVQPEVGAVPLPDATPPAAAAAVLKPTDGQDAAAVAAVLKPDLTAALDLHNTYRQRHQAPALVWDDSLAASAAKWAAGCPNGHSGYPGVGENMAWGYASLADAVDAWYNEVKLYDFSKPGWNTATGHFTALVWKSTSKLGCAINTACGMATYVCQYQAPGNVIGVDWSAQVKPAMSSAPASPAPTPKSSPAPSKPSSSSAVLPKRSTRRSPAPVLTASPASVAVVSPKAADMQQVLDLHNTFRRVHQAPALVWDEKLAASAQAWADTCSFGSSSTPGVGENLGFGYTTFQSAVKSWYQQVSSYDFDSPGWTSGSGLFTQLVWGSTRAVGCGVNTACPWATYVCHYSPPGNMAGPSIDWSQQVKPAAGALPAAAAVPKPQADTAGEGEEDASGDNAWDAQLVQPQGGSLHGGSSGHLAGHDGPTTAAVGYPDSREPLDPDLLEALRRTNTYRKRHQVAPLSWDEGLAQQAASFLADCPLKHSTVRNIGESLGWGFRSFADVVDAWYNEVNSYHFNKPGWSVLAGHFSQMVWKDTTNIGCAVNHKCTWDTYICQYSPPGNVVSADWSTQVFPPLPESPEEQQQLLNPTLRPGEAYYEPNRGAANAAAQGPAPEVPDVTPYPAADTTTAAPQYPAETPVTPSATPVTPLGPPEAPPQTAVPPPQYPYQVPTMPAEQTPPQNGSSSDTGRSSSSSSSSSQVPGLSSELQAGFDATNSYRRQHAAPDLVWDAAIASQAASYVAGCPNGHSGQPGFGENLAWGYDSLSAAVKAWYDEVSVYDFNTGGFSGATGHFTQLVWRDSSKVGCAVNKACSMPTYICQYSPAGNVMGVDWSQQVQPKTNTPAPAPTAPAPAAPTPSYTPVPPTQQIPPTAPPQPLTPPASTWGQQQTQQSNWWQTPQQQRPRQQPLLPQQQQQPYYTPVRPAQPFQAPPEYPVTPATPQQRPLQEPAYTPLNPTQPTADTTEPQQEVTQLPPQEVTPVTPAPAAPAAAAATDPSIPAAYAVVMEATNRYRAKHQVAALTWNTALAARAQAYADSCPGGHSGDKGVGENLAWGYPSWQAAVDAWYNEVSSYSFSNPGWSGATGHFTQLVWKDTTSVGCGFNARCAMPTYVCQYSPAGNVLGNGWSSQVLPPVS